MKLSKLVYLCIKNVVYLNESFDYRSFLLGQYDDDPDFDTNINNVFSPLNEAIARLSDLDRIPYKVEIATLKQGTNEIELNNLLQDEENLKEIEVKELHAVGQFINGKPTYIEAKKVGNVIMVLGKLSSSASVFVEYKEDIPEFTREDIPDKNSVTEDLDDIAVSEDVDLKEYGITDSMCNFIIEYVQGKLMEVIAPDIANMHITRAEAYFSNIRTNRPLFLQRGVVQKYTIGE